MRSDYGKVPPIKSLLYYHADEHLKCIWNRSQPLSFLRQLVAITRQLPVSPLPSSSEWSACRRHAPFACAPGCGLLPNGDCQRFQNILALNRRGSPLQVTNTRGLECRGIRAVGGQYRRPCYYPCPGRPVIWRRTPRRAELCVRSRNLHSCKLLANNCQLLYQNCHGRPSAQ